jgi:excisionase family DNA binding protein
MTPKLKRPAADAVLISTDEVAQLVDVSPRTIRNWMTRGKIPFVKIGRVVRFDREEFLQVMRDNTKHL